MYLLLSHYILMKLKLYLLAFVNSPSSNGASHIRQQWLGWWLVAYGPKPLPEPMVTLDYCHPSQSIFLYTPMTCPNGGVSVANSMSEQVIALSFSCSSCDIYMTVKYWTVIGYDLTLLSQFCNNWTTVFSFMFVAVSSLYSKGYWRGIRDPVWP